MNKKIVVVLNILLIFVIIIVFWNTTKTFYQQDEWHGYGIFLSKGFGSVFSSATYLSSSMGPLFSNTHGIINILLGEGRILTNLLLFFLYKYFPLNVFPVAIFAIILHTVNSLIVFYLVRKLFNNTLSAFLASLFFALNSVSQNAVTWVAASVNTLPSTTLILISLALFFRYLKEDAKKWLFVSFLLIYISLFFKETGIFLFIFLPISTFIFKKHTLVEFAKTYWYFFLTALAIVAFRLIEFMYIPHQEALFLTGSTSNYWAILLTRTVFYPITSFSLVFVPPEPFLMAARFFTLAYYPFPSSPTMVLVAQTAVLDLLSVCLSFLILSLITLLIRFASKVDKKLIIFFCIFLLFNYLPYTVVSKSYSYLESRYYYLASFPTGVILSWLAVGFYKRLSSYKKIKVTFLKPVLVFTFLIFVGWHAKYIFASIQRDVETSSERIQFIHQLKAITPNLEGNTNIFYINSDTDYYIAGNKVPFQQGMGYTLMTLYYDSGEIPASLLRDGYLFEIGNQGYKEVDGFGFGYFSDEKAMEIQLKRYRIPPSSIFRFYYDSKNRKLTEINNVHIK